MLLDTVKSRNSAPKLHFAKMRQICSNRVRIGQKAGIWVELWIRNPMYLQEYWKFSNKKKSGGMDYHSKHQTHSNCWTELCARLERCGPVSHFCSIFRIFLFKIARQRYQKWKYFRKQKILAVRIIMLSNKLAQIFDWDSDLLWSDVVLRPISRTRFW